MIRLVVFSFIFVLAGCSSTNDKRTPDPVTAEQGAKRASAEATALLDESDSQRHRKAFREVNRYWLGSPNEIRIKDPLPESLKSQISYSTYSPMSIQEIARLITEISGIRSRIAEDVIRPLPNSAASLIPDVQGAGASGMGSRWSDEVELMGTGRERITFNVDGTVEDLLNLVSSRLNISWRVDDGVLIFHRYVTRSFQLNIIDERLSSTSASGEGQEDEQSGSENVNSEITKNVYADVMDLMAGLMSDSGVMTRSPSTSGFTVTDTSDVVDAIEREVERTNEDLTRQVALNVRIYSINDVDSEEFEFSLDLLYTGMDASAAIQKISDPIGDISGINFNGAYLMSDWAGSQINYDNVALRENVSIVTRSTNITTNNRTVPIESVRITNFISGVTTSRSDLSSGVDTEIEQDVVTTGLNMQLTPKILSDDRVLIHYSVNIKDLISLFEKQINDASVQQPDITRRKIINQAIMRSGSTLVLTGLHVSNNEYKDSGSFWPWFKLFGGSQRDDANTEMAVIMITPVLLGNSVGEPRT
jgi:type IVB pilus formation R64 PilN family outer membrane protein